MELEEIGLEEWEDTLPSNDYDVFHTTEALRVVRHHTPGEVKLYRGFRGQETVGLFPICIRSKVGVRLLTSPSLGFGIGRLGPVLMPLSPKQHKQEATNKEFIRGVLDAVGADGPRTLLRMACSPRYHDPRPFSWSGFKVTPAFTYRLDLADTNASDLLNAFSRDLRREIRKRDEVGFAIRIGGIDEAEHTYRSLASRYHDQAMRMPLTWEYFRDLLQTFGDDQARVYVAESGDGTFISGMVILYSRETAYFWKGGVKTNDTACSPNSLLHWRIIEDILTDPALASITAYDFYTANNERLVEYKGKFGGTLIPYYIIESNGFATSLAKKIYRMSAIGKPFSWVF